MAAGAAVKPLLRTTPCLGWWFGGPHQWPASATGKPNERCVLCGHQRHETKRPRAQCEAIAASIPGLRAEQLRKAGHT